MLVITLLGGRYLVWRIGAPLDLATAVSTGLSLLMLVAELTLLANGLLQLWLTWARQPPVPQEAAAAERTLQQISGSQTGPSAGCTGCSGEGAGHPGMAGAGADRISGN
ncbi:hypothetical protein [Synechococcus sp. 1G10]|uniref:hypothetical protein n=1 Tax=Synechococcus sp. 1G10 TaxID=2025605 RepID=UPI000B97EE82|nr:hypothetical protein [Synechococcus sp. 1G10]